MLYLDKCFLIAYVTVFRTLIKWLGRRLTISAVEEDKLRFLVETGFRLRDLASKFGCSTRTVERQLQRLNISLRSYNMFSDEKLDSCFSGDSV